MSKKQEKKETKKDIAPKTRKSYFPTGKTLFFLYSVLAGLVSYFVYNALITPPPLPVLDLKEWWGSYPMAHNRDLSIRPYEIEFSDVMVNDLRERLLHRRPFTPPLEGAGFTYGFNSHFLTRVLDYWQNKYNFRERQHFLNKYEHFLTNIQGLDIHFMRVRPVIDSNYSVVPILLLHGWPDSVREFYELVPLLTAPRPGYKVVFEVIAPSLPGYGFSQAAVRPGLGTAQVAVIMRNLMHRIGYKHYYVHGGDWGANIGANMATLFPEDVLGLHTNLPVAMNALATVYTFLGSLWPRAVVEPQLQSRMYPLLSHFSYLLEETGYVHIQATKPDTIGIALTDSPAGLAAYILEKYSTWTNRESRRAADGALLVKFSLTHLLDNVMIYWSTNSITSSVRLYAESMRKEHWALKLEEIPTDVPTWGIKFKHELMFQPDCLLRLKFRNYLHSTIVEDGGHFAAIENPDILADDIFEAVDTFIQFHAAGKKLEQKEPESHETATTIYDFTVNDINGKSVKLDKYRGHVTLIVNVASECGLTHVNYKQLNELYEKYAVSKGLRILAFPCNQFGGQEPGSLKDILTFAKQSGVKFDVFEKVEVNGENAHPLWKFLTRVQGGTLGDFIKWNFSKFIVDKNGVPVERLAPNVKPLDLEPTLAKYW